MQIEPYEPYKKVLVVKITEMQWKLLQSLVNPDKHLWTISDVVREAINRYLKEELNKKLETKQA
jgi:hypothetical protein